MLTCQTEVKNCIIPLKTPDMWLCAYLRNFICMHTHTKCRQIWKHETDSQIISPWKKFLTTSQNKTRFGVLVAVFLDVILHSFVDRYQHLEEHAASIFREEEGTLLLWRLSQEGLGSMELVTYGVSFLNSLKLWIFVYLLPFLMVINVSLLQVWTEKLSLWTHLHQ
jgi:hypothetical protein